MAGGFVPYDKRITDPVHNDKYISELTNEIEQRFANVIDGWTPSDYQKALDFHLKPTNIFYM